MHAQFADVRMRPPHRECRSYNEKLSIDKPVVIETYPQVRRDNSPYAQAGSNNDTTSLYSSHRLRPFSDSLKLFLGLRGSTGGACAGGVGDAGAL